MARGFRMGGGSDNSVERLNFKLFVSHNSDDKVKTTDYAKTQMTLTNVEQYSVIHLGYGSSRYSEVTIKVQAYDQTQYTYETIYEITRNGSYFNIDYDVDITNYDHIRIEMAAQGLNYAESYYFINASLDDCYME